MQMIGLARLGRDAEVRYTPESTAVANLSLAFNYGARGEDGKRPVQWVDASLWGKRAESLGEYLLKGVALVVTLDDVHIERFQTRDGTPGSKLVGKVSSIEFAGGGDQRAQAPAPAPAARQPASRPAASRPAPPTGSGFDNMDDDIPFRDPLAGRAWSMS